MKKIFILLITMLLLMFTCQVRAQLSYTVPQFTTNCPLSVTTNAPAAWQTNTANWFRLRANQGLAMAISVTATNVSATNGPVLFGFNLSLDGTNWSTAGTVNGQAWPIQVSVPAFGNTNVVGVTNFSPLFLNNFKWLRLDQVSNNNTNLTVVNGIVVGYFPNNGVFNSQ